MKSEKNSLFVEVTEAFTESVRKKYHFPAQEKAAMAQVAADLHQAVSGRAGFWYVMQKADAVTQKPTLASVVMTLGAGVDELQEHYTRRDALLECYMAEALAGELLLSCYPRMNRLLGEREGLYPARYCFYGSQEEYPLEAMKTAPALLGQTEVVCNRALCLVPKKSVVFFVELTRDEKTVCQGVCTGCGQRDCPNWQAEDDAKKQGRWPDLLSRPLPYGYERILGR